MMRFSGIFLRFLFNFSGIVIFLFNFHEIFDFSGDSRLRNDVFKAGSDRNRHLIWGTITTILRGLKTAFLRLRKRLFWENGFLRIPGVFRINFSAFNRNEIEN